MHRLTYLVLLILLAVPVGLSAQEVDVAPWHTAPAVGVFAGLGSGPIDAATWGVEASVPLWRYLALRAEYSGWGNGVGGTMCPGEPPYSHRCSVSGWAGLVGISTNIPLEESFGLYAGASGGRFSRNWIEDQRVNSMALSVEAGARVRLYRGLSARVGARFLRAFDDDYAALLGENLRYTMGIFGLEYGIPR